MPVPTRRTSPRPAACALAALVLLASVPADTVAQRGPVQARPFGVHRPVRVVLAGGSPAIVGRLREVRGDTIVLDLPGRATPLALAGDAVADVQVRERNRYRDGVMTAGAIAGLAAGTWAAMRFCDGGREDCWFTSADSVDRDGDGEIEGAGPGPGIVVAVIGGFAGAGLGALLTPDRWRSAGHRATAPLRVGVRVARGGAALALSLPFGGPARDAPSRTRE